MATFVSIVASSGLPTTTLRQLTLYIAIILALSFVWAQKNTTPRRAPLKTSASDTLTKLPDKILIPDSNGILKDEGIVLRDSILSDPDSTTFPLTGLHIPATGRRLRTGRFARRAKRILPHNQGKGGS